MLKKGWLIVAFFYTCLAMADIEGRNGQGTPTKVTLAVAGNMVYAIDELKKEFNRQKPGVELVTIIASSGKLTAQISNGAPYDIFLSADMKYPENLFKNGHAITKPMVYAQGLLVLFTVDDLNISKGLDILSDITVRRIAMANPSVAPYGIAAMEAMKKFGVYTKLRDKYVFAESISQTMQLCLTAVNVGFIAKSAIFSPKVARYNIKGKHWVDVPRELYRPIKQGVVVLKHGENNQYAFHFYEFLKSEKSKEILRKFGYKV